MNKQLMLNITLIIVIILLGWFHCCEVKNFKGEITTWKRLGDTLELIRNKDSSQTAKISLLETKNISAYLALENLEGINKELQNELKKEKSKVKNGGSVTVINSETIFESSNPNDTIVKSLVNDCDSIFKSSSKDTTWIKYDIVAKKTNTTIKLRVKDKFKVVIGSEKEGLFKRKPIAEVTSYNPYSNIKSMRAIEIEDNSSHRLLSISAQLGYGFTFKGVSPYLGCGISLDIIECIKRLN